LIKENPSLVTNRRHIEMALSNLGDGFGGSWRNEIGRLAYVEIMAMLLRFLYDRQCLES
jgi:hypothetical protein